MATNSSPFTIAIRVKDLETAQAALRAFGKEGESALRRIERAASVEALKQKLRPALDEVRGGVEGLSGRLGPLGSGLAALGPAGLAAAAGLAVLTGGLTAAVQAAGQMQKLEATLRVVSGSARLASEDFARLKEFAVQTPVSIEGATEAFIKLRALGLEASIPALRSYGNTAAALGKDITMFIEAVADAATGEFERLKEFGIKAANEGETVRFTFQGVTREVANDARSIQAYLLEIGNTKFASGLDEQSRTLGGATDRLADSWTVLLETI
ncbi:MAG TPA: tape measure protein, partial [Azospirillaceae bacterium]|nr:tape measure protein [Azospirillaceae bacterium]